jgi:hypothetical protein
MEFRPVLPHRQRQEGKLFLFVVQHQLQPVRQEHLKHQGKLLARRIGRSLRDNVEPDVFGLVRPRELCVGRDAISKLEAIAQTGIRKTDPSVASR